MVQRVPAQLERGPFRRGALESGCEKVVLEGVEGVRQATGEGALVSLQDRTDTS
jgi:hypothetical protein